MAKHNEDGTLRYDHNGSMSVLEQTIRSLEQKRKKAIRIIAECDALLAELKAKTDQRKRQR